jgi:hypothetical protein
MTREEEEKRKNKNKTRSIPFSYWISEIQLS